MPPERPARRENLAAMSRIILSRSRSILRVASRATAARARAICSGMKSPGRGVFAAVRAPHSGVDDLLRTCDGHLEPVRGLVGAPPRGQSLLVGRHLDAELEPAGHVASIAEAVRQTRIPTHEAPFPPGSRVSGGGRPTRPGQRATRREACDRRPHASPSGNADYVVRAGDLSDELDDRPLRRAIPPAGQAAGKRSGRVVGLGHERPSIRGTSWRRPRARGRRRVLR